MLNLFNAIKPFIRIGNIEENSKLCKKESEEENKVIEVKENTTMEKYVYKQDNTKRHIAAIIASPIYAPQVRDYFYQAARVGAMNLERSRSANPVPTFPTIGMIANQQNYAIRLGESMLIDKDFTETLIDLAIEKAGELGTIEAGTLAKEIDTFVLG